MIEHGIQKIVFQSSTMVLGSAGFMGTGCGGVAGGSEDVLILVYTDEEDGSNVDQSIEHTGKT